MKSEMSPSSATTPQTRKLILFSMILALLGLLASLYATQHHMEVKLQGASSAACNINDTFSCDDVAKSAYSEIAGTPLAVLGISFFAALLALLGVGLQKPEYRRDNLLTYSFLAGSGVVISLVLAAISMFVIEKICPSCLVIYGICFAQLAVLARWRGGLPVKPWQFKSLGNGFSYILLSLIICIGGYQFLKPTPMDFHKDDPQIEIGNIQNQLQKQQTKLTQTSATIKIDRSAMSGLGEDYRLGPDDAKVVLVEFADFQCPACRNAAKKMKALREEFGEKLQIVFKNYPIDKACNAGVSRDVHRSACEAAIIARCAGLYGKFWPMHDAIFANQSKISGPHLKDLAKQIGLNEEQISQCKKSDSLLKKIKQDIAQGDSHGVKSTPTIYINNHKMAGGASLPAIKNFINRLLQE